MSVHRVSTGYAVRWREGARNRRRTFDRRADALRWDGEVRRRKQNGSLAALDAGSTTLDAYVVETWAPTYGPLLAPRTRRVYASVYNGHVAPRLGRLALHALTPPVIAAWQAAELSAGTGHATIAKARGMLGAVLRTAVEAELIARNPLRVVRKPHAPLREEVRPLAPSSVEALRAVLAPRDPPWSPCSPTPACARRRPARCAGGTSASAR